MNSIDINLLSTNQGSHDKEKRLRHVKIAAFGFMFFVGILSIITFFLNISSPLNQIKKDQSAILQNITSQQDKAAKLSVLNERASAISKIYKHRHDYESVIILVLSKKTDDIITSGLDIGENSVTVSVSSSSLLPINNFLNSVIDVSKKSDSIKSVFLDNLSVNQTSSSYIMGVKVNLK